MTLNLPAFAECPVRKEGDECEKGNQKKKRRLPYAKVMGIIFVLCVREILNENEKLCSFFFG
jgi:hypothetical protein